MVTLNDVTMKALGIDFIDMDFMQPVPDMPEPIISFDDKLQIKGVGSGVVPENPDDWGRWDEIQMFEGQLMTELNRSFQPGVTRFEQDAWDNAIDLDDMPKGPDPYKHDPLNSMSYEEAINEALNVHNILYSIY